MNKIQRIKTVNKGISFLDFIRGIKHTAADLRENAKLVVAFFLAMGCWGSYGFIIHTQFADSRSTSAEIKKIAQVKPNPSPEDRERIAIIKDANDVVDKTANSIYALLTPISTAITGFFFVSTGSKVTTKDSDKSIDDPITTTTSTESNPLEAGNGNTTSSEDET